nr:aromatic ring-hydroxylating dioxygenase subunit alpha [Sphingomonas sp. Y57]
MSVDLKNVWYVAAMSGEVAEKPFSRTICGTPVALYRSASGALAAVHDRCPHRFVPLSMGSVKGEALVCGYHGLAFAADGACVENPQGAVTKSLTIRSFTVQERYGLIWIWMGDADLAALTPIPDFSLIDDAALRPQWGYIHSKAHFELMTDNILDLSHIEFLHAGTLGTEKIRDAKTASVVEGRTVFSHRTVDDEILTPFLDRSFETGGRPVTRTLSVRWDPPGLMLLTVAVNPAGPEQALRETYNMHFMTPETATTAHYFWVGTRRYGPDDPERDRLFRAGLENAFLTEDKPMIEAQQRSLGSAELLDLGPALFKGDAAAIQARRILDEMRRAEAAASRPAS